MESGIKDKKIQSNLLDSGITVNDARKKERGGRDGGETCGEELMRKRTKEIKLSIMIELENCSSSSGRGHLESGGGGEGIGGERKRGRGGERGRERGKMREIEVRGGAHNRL